MPRNQECITKGASANQKISYKPHNTVAASGNCEGLVQLAEVGPTDADLRSGVSAEVYLRRTHRLQFAESLAALVISQPHHVAAFFRRPIAPASHGRSAVIPHPIIVLRLISS